MAGPKRTNEEIQRATYKRYTALIGISISEKMKEEVQSVAFRKNISISKLFRDLFAEKYGKEMSNE